MLLALGLFFVAILQGGVLRQWFSPTETLRIVLPEQGLFGLAAGAPVEILGTKAGEVRRIVIDPGQSFYAEADIDDSMQTFVRRDSRAFIRKQFGIAGAAYLEITRGQGEPLDWDYAVVTAEVDRAPTENVGQLIEDLRAKVLPIIDKTDRAVTALAELAESLRAPDGDLSRLLASTQTILGGVARGDGRLLCLRQQRRPLLPIRRWRLSPPTATNSPAGWQCCKAIRPVRAAPSSPLPTPAAPPLTTPA